MLRGMIANPPRPELWTRTAALLAILRRLIFRAGPEGFAAIAAEARAHLAAATALVRRYIHVLAGDLSLPPLGSPRATPPEGQAAPTHLQRREALFCLTEEGRPAGLRGAGGEPDPVSLQWALMTEALRRLGAVMADPSRHALRLARHLRRNWSAPLRALPVPGHILRRLPPSLDALLSRLDQLARPQDWAGIDPCADTS